MDPQMLEGHHRMTLKDQVTPHKVTILLLIQEYCTRVFQQNTLSSSMIGDLPDMYTQKEERDLLFAMLKLMQVT